MRPPGPACSTVSVVIIASGGRVKPSSAPFPASHPQEAGLSRRIVVIQGHADASVAHLCHVLARHYTDGATAAGHEVRRIEVATIDFPLLSSKAQWEHGELPGTLRSSLGRGAR